MEKQNTKWKPSEVIAILGRTKDFNIFLNGRATRKQTTLGNQKTN
jgi:hypothetical protein